jgi:glycosyltransferase involved in cell wall biosynthesis
MISIVIPTYRKLDMLKVTIESAINQIGNINYEIVVVNDYPDDKETEVYLKQIDDNRINYYVNEKNLGLFGNWNRCIELAQGTWISLLNDDDILYPDYLEKVTSILKKPIQIDFLYSAHDLVKVKNAQQALQILKHHSHGKRIREQKKQEEERLFQKGPLLSKIYLLDFFFEHQITHPLGQLMRKDILLKLGGYNEDYYPSADWVLNFNFCLNGSLYYYNEKIGCRTEGINVSARKETKIKFIEIDYRFRKEMAKIIRLPLKNWYVCCFLANYAKLFDVYQDIKIMQIKKRSITDLELQKFIMHLYNKIRTTQNYLNYKKLS